MQPQHILYLVIINLIWGAAPVALKLGVGHMPPLLLMSLRFILASAVLLPVTRWHGGQMRNVAWAAMFNGALNFGLLGLGLALVGHIAPVGIAVQLGVPFATILSIVFLKEVVRWRRWLGIMLSFGGGSIVAFDPEVVRYLDAFGLITLASFCGSAAMIFMRKLQNVSALQFQAWVAHLSWPVLLLFSFLVEQDQGRAIEEAGLTAWFAIAYTALGSSLIAHAGFFRMVQIYEVSHVAPFLLLAPLFTIAIGVVVFHDPLSARMLIGGLLTLAGVGIITIRDRHVVEEHVAP